jgi:hypothetical protein
LKVQLARDVSGCKRGFFEGDRMIAHDRKLCTRS